MSSSVYEALENFTQFFGSIGFYWVQKRETSEITAKRTNQKKKIYVQSRSIFG